MAQLVAHLLCKQGVRGSSPLGSTQVRGPFRSSDEGALSRPYTKLQQCSSWSSKCCCRGCSTPAGFPQRRPGSRCPGHRDLAVSEDGHGHARVRVEGNQQAGAGSPRAECTGMIGTPACGPRSLKARWKFRGSSGIPNRVVRTRPPCLSKPRPGVKFWQLSIRVGGVSQGRRTQMSGRGRRASDDRCLVGRRIRLATDALKLPGDAGSTAFTVEVFPGEAGAGPHDGCRGPAAARRRPRGGRRRRRATTAGTRAPGRRSR